MKHLMEVQTSFDSRSARKNAPQIVGSVQQILIAGALITAMIVQLKPAQVLGAETASDLPAASVPATRPGSDGEKPKYRNFYEVLEDVLADFEYDLKNNDVKGLRDLSIRNVALSESVPPSFKTHLELVVSERILKTTKNSKLIQCLPCRARTTTAQGNQVVITSTESNAKELGRIAELNGIANFMDLAFTYQPSGIMLSMYVTEATTGNVIWSRSYNSETSRASAFRRGVDFSQVAEARQQQEYVPTVQYRLTSYYMFNKNVSSYTGTLGLGFRMMERYDNRHKEVGFEVAYYRDSSSLINPNGTEGTPNLYGGLNVTLLFMHSWNLIGPEENYNLVRGNIFGGLGGTYSSGYLSGLLRMGYEWRMAKRWAVSSSLGYKPKATAFFNGSSVGSVSGFEIGIGISHLF